nr:proline dehydrogenase family protein [Parachlamydiaceae bacterium]
MKNSQVIAKAKHILNNTKGKTLTVAQRKDTAIELAALLLTEARNIQTHGEKEVQTQLANMMNDSNGKAFTMSMTDQCFRSQNPYRVADQLTYLLKQFGIPAFLNYLKKVQLKIFCFLGKPFAKTIVPLTKSMLRRETRLLILPGEPDNLLKHMRQRRKEGVRINLNHLGEAILGEAEADHRLSTYLSDLANPEVEYISIKISTIYSQLNLLGWENTLNVLSSRLSKLYASAKIHLYTLPNGEKVPKFINLDMEEY